MSTLVFIAQYPQLVGIPLILIYGLWRYRSNASRNQQPTDWLIAATALAIPAELVAQALTAWMSSLRPLKLDLYVYCLDGTLGFQPSFVIGRVVEQHFWLKMILAFTYGSCSLAMLSVLAAYLRCRSRSEVLVAMKAFALNLFAALPIYLLIPVCGPKFAFPGFPSSVLQQVSPHAMAIWAPPNGVPSVHFSTALLVAWLARHWFWGRILGPAYVVLTAVVTLGSGQHYLFDLIAAVPYAFLIYRISRADATNRRPGNKHWRDSEQVCVKL